VFFKAHMRALHYLPETIKMSRCVIALLLVVIQLPRAIFAATNITCKTSPSSADWPSAQEWATFNTTVNGALLHPSPPAAPCHPSLAEYNQALCRQITSSFTNSQWHSDNPVSTDWTNIANYSCELSANSPCSGAGYPIYVVNASRAELVVSAVQFAASHNLRLNIKSTGHDFLGR
jgi:hypothetical protein